METRSLLWLVHCAGDHAKRTRNNFMGTQFMTKKEKKNQRRWFLRSTAWSRWDRILFHWHIFQFFYQLQQPMLFTCSKGPNIQKTYLKLNQCKLSLGTSWEVNQQATNFRPFEAMNTMISLNFCRPALTKIKRARERCPNASFSCSLLPFHVGLFSSSRGRRLLATFPLL